MADDVTYPVPVSGRISEATNRLVAQAKKANALLSTGTLVRMALEAFMPRYVEDEGAEDAELNSVVNEAVRLDPKFKARLRKEAKDVIKARIREGVRRGRAA